MRAFAAKHCGLKGHHYPPYAFSRDSGHTRPSPLGSEAAQGDEGLAAPSSTATTPTHVNCHPIILQLNLANIKCDLQGPSPLRSKAAQVGEGLAAPAITLNTASRTKATHNTKSTHSTHRHGALSNLSAGVETEVEVQARVSAYHRLP